MAKIIQKEELQRHNVNKYSFKVLAIGSHKKEKEKTKPQTPQEKSVETIESPQQQENAAAVKTSKDELIESLLKKVDDMGSNFIKLQMKLEDMQEEHKKELEKISQESYEKGLAEGRELGKKEVEDSYANSLNLFSNSISKLEEISNKYNTAIENTKKELVSAAVDIAKEVVEIELSENSSKVAQSLAESLIDELKDAASITIKVNPNDFVALQESLKDLKNVKVVSDSAIAQGGVVAISDIENIDAQIKNRFERVKKVVLNGL